MVINKLFPVYEDLGVEMIWYEDTENPIDYLNKCINKNEMLGIDKDWPARFLIQLINSNAAKGFVNGSPIIDRVRMIKDAEEIEIMKASSKINDAVMLKLWDNCKIYKRCAKYHMTCKKRNICFLADSKHNYKQNTQRKTGYNIRIYNRYLIHCGNCLVNPLFRIECTNGTCSSKYCCKQSA